MGLVQQARWLKHWSMKLGIPEASARRVIPITAVATNAVAADELMVSLYAAEQKIYPRSVSGWFAWWRWALVAATQALYYGLPWLQWGERQAVLFDLGTRRFYVFGWVLYPQDFIYLTGVLVVSALSLFLFTAVAGRLWCGYACPQTVYTEMFMWIEQKIEGDRSARMRLDAGPKSLAKLSRKTLKHIVWLALALWTGFTFVGYFSPIRDLGAAVAGWHLGPWETFWILFYSFATYGNAGFMREQVCKYMCPYARFQSAMFDRDTLIITYDEQRGEPRGRRSRSADPVALSLGACVDCSLCVQVCPTGIDIRKGLQYECIGCAACVDVCNGVMDKMGYARGLIKYTTQNGLAHGWAGWQVFRRALRPRVLVYGAILGAVVTAMAIGLALRVPFKVDVVRDRAVMARIVAGGQIENVYRLQLMNAKEAARTYQFSATGLPGLAVVTDHAVTVEPAQARWAVVRLRVPAGELASGSHSIHFEIKSVEDNATVVEKSVFFVPK
jgi:cytochrome c oxidase accessory protein FixG